jgi:nicotinate-nucleotide pyrophosphorylase
MAKGQGPGNILSAKTEKYRITYEEEYENGEFKHGKIYTPGDITVTYHKQQILAVITGYDKFYMTENFSIDDTKAATDITDLRAEVLNDTSYGNTKDTVGAFRKVEISACFPGGESSWKKFLMRNLNTDSVWDDLPATIKLFTQTVWVQFIVCTDGTVCNVETMNVVLPSLKKEAERVIKLSGKWVPAVQNGRSVKAYRKQPITFQYSSE